MTVDVSMICNARFMLTETWRAIPGYPGYEASDEGNVRSLDRTTVSKAGVSRLFRGKVLRLQDLTGRGYLYAGLWLNGKLKYERVNRLVLLAFVGTPSSPDLQALHDNDVKGDNRLSNLRWGTGTENSQDAIRNGIHPEASKTRCINDHPFTAENTYERPDGKGRACRQCMLERGRKYRGVVHPRGRYRGGGASYVD